MPEIYLWMPWILSAISLISIWLLRGYRRVGWLIGVVSGVMCVAYNLVTHQYGFIPQNIIGAVICLSSYRAWRRRPATSCACRDGERENSVYAGEPG